MQIEKNIFNLTTKVWKLEKRKYSQHNKQLLTQADTHNNQIPTTQQNPTLDVFHGLWLVEVGSSSTLLENLINVNFEIVIALRYILLTLCQHRAYY